MLIIPRNDLISQAVWPAESQDGRGWLVHNSKVTSGNKLVTSASRPTQLKLGTRRKVLWKWRRSVSYWPYHPPSSSWYIKILVHALMPKHIMRACSPEPAHQMCNSKKIYQILPQGSGVLKGVADGVTAPVHTWASTLEEGIQLKK